MSPGNVVGKPLNGSKTHPLKPASIAVLRALRTYPLPQPEVNPGIRDRLEREGLVETVMLPSPYRTRKGNQYPHSRITTAGLLCLERLEEENRRAASSSLRQDNANTAIDGEPKKPTR